MSSDIILAMAKRTGGESLAVDVYDQLRTDIFDRRFAPGQRLKPAELGERFGVSISVMREALGLLAAQNLVRIERNRGFHVTTLSPDALADLTLARKINEGAALRRSVERGGVSWESEVLAAHHRMASEPIYRPDDPRSRNPAWAAAHIAFHEKLIDACGSPVLLDICHRLSDAAELYRAWSGAWAEGRQPVRRDIATEHRQLMEAALAHDADLAVQLFEAHVDRTAAILMDHADPAPASSPEKPAEKTH
jgi:DNA-binding GntR family transcriptional regulator